MGILRPKGPKKMIGGMVGKGISAYAKKAGIRQSPLAGAKQALGAFKAGRTKKK